jgi:hypothetical protein
MKRLAGRERTTEVASDTQLLHPPAGRHCMYISGHAQSPLSTDAVEKLRKRIAEKFRPNDILSENRCSMPPQCGYGGRLLLQRQLPRPPKSFFDSPAHGSTNYGSSPKTEFFNSIDPKQKSDLRPLCASCRHRGSGQETRNKRTRDKEQRQISLPLADRRRPRRRCGMILPVLNEDRLEGFFRPKFRRADFFQAGGVPI